MRMAQNLKAAFAKAAPVCGLMLIFLDAKAESVLKIDLTDQQNESPSSWQKPASKVGSEGSLVASSADANLHQSEHQDSHQSIRTADTTDGLLTDESYHPNLSEPPSWPDRADASALNPPLEATIADTPNLDTQSLPDQQRQSPHDLRAANLAAAKLALKNNQYKKAGALYRQLLLETPEAANLRLDLAHALYADKQYWSAQLQLQQLLEEGVGPKIKKRAEKMLSRIHRVHSWRGSATLRYLNDDNINNAPPETIQDQFDKHIEPQSAEGVQLTATAARRISLPNNFFASLGGNASLKGYWDASDYNNYIVTASAGAGYEDAHNKVVIRPFITRRFYDEQPQSFRFGAGLQGSSWITPELKVTATGRFFNETYDNDKERRREKDGQFIGLQALYKLSTKTTLTGSLGAYQNEMAKTTSANYDRHSLSASWSQSWPKDISTRLSARYAIKAYEDPATRYADNSAALERYYASVGGALGSRRIDKSVGINLTLWRRGLKLWGLLPKLMISHKSTDSNFRYYDDRKDSLATLLLTKRF